MPALAMSALSRARHARRVCVAGVHVARASRALLMIVTYDTFHGNSFGHSPVQSEATIRIGQGVT